MGFANGRRISNTGPYSCVRSAKSAGTLPVRTCRLNTTFRNGTAGIFLVRAECRSKGPARLWETASAMDRPMTSILQMSWMRASDSSSSWKMKRKTSHVLTRQITITSLGSGISFMKIALPIRVLMN